MEEKNKHKAEVMPSGVQRMTKQRAAIIEMLLKSKDHPTAEEIHAAVKEQLPGINIGTVYRNLHMLIADGLVQEINRGKLGSRFDGNQMPHSHFFCRCCGKVYDIPTCEVPISAEIEEMLPGTLEMQRTDFFGVCEACRA